MNPECIFCLSLSLSSRAQGHNGSLFFGDAALFSIGFFSRFVPDDSARRDCEDDDDGGGASGRPRALHCLSDLSMRLSRWESRAEFDNSSRAPERRSMSPKSQCASRRRVVHPPLRLSLSLARASHPPVLFFLPFALSRSLPFLLTCSATASRVRENQWARQRHESQIENINLSAIQILSN